MSEVKLVTLSEANLGSLQLFCGHSPTYRKGYRAKQEWLQARLHEGMRYTLIQVGGHNAGLVEYLPGEAAWRGVEAKGYLFIHCFWVIGSNRGHGFGRRLLEACLEDAARTNGVAVMVSKAHWLPTPRLFLKNGFELVDQAPPSFDLLVKRLDPAARLPYFSKKTTALPTGLVVYTSSQCPYTQNVPAIAERVGEQLKVPVTIVRLESAVDAQVSPCLNGTLGYFYNGEFLTYHPAGTEKLLGLLEPKLAARGG